MKQGNLCSHRKREYTDTENEEKLTANSSIGWRERERVLQQGINIRIRKVAICLSEDERDKAPPSVSLVI